MYDNGYKTPEELANIINSTNETSDSRINYYKNLLSNCASDLTFQNMLNTVKFKEVIQLPRNNRMYRFVIKCNNANNNVVVGPVDNNVNINDNNSFKPLSIPMRHYHLSKNNYIQDNFIYRISNNETGAIAKFIERLRLIDNRIQSLIANYIKNIEVTSPIANLIRKNNVTYNTNWIYTGIINKINDREYVNIRFFKDSINGNAKFGTKVYTGNDKFIEMADLLSRNTYSYVTGEIYPIIKVNYVLINERIINGKPIVNFTCKAYFVDLIFSQKTAHCSVEKRN